MHQSTPLSQASPWVRISGAGMLRTTFPVSGSIRKIFSENGTAIQYLPSTHFTPWPPDGVAFGPGLPHMPDSGVTHAPSVLPVAGSILRVIGGVPGFNPFVDVIQSAPFPSVIPLPCIDSV